MPDDTKQMDFEDKPVHAREDEEPTSASVGATDEVGDDDDMLDDDEWMNDDERPAGTDKDLDRDRQNP